MSKEEILKRLVDAWEKMNGPLDPESKIMELLDNTAEQLSTLKDDSLQKEYIHFLVDSNIPDTAKKDLEQGNFPVGKV